MKAKCADPTIDRARPNPQLRDGALLSYIGNNAASQCTICGVLGKKSKSGFLESIADLFDRARSEADSLGHHLQAAAKFSVAFFHMVPNFAAFKLRNRRVAKPTPSYGLPILQLTNFSA
jgi:hypothetical protein